VDDSLCVDWGDIGETEFTDPFFGQTIRRWVQVKNPTLRRTDLQELLALAADDATSPRAIIFHSSRCGSTLVGRMLAGIHGMQVLSEPGPVNDLLIECPGRLDQATCVRALGSLVRALVRSRHASHRHFVLKTSSWNIRYHALLERAFPDVPMIWIHRDPAEVLASVLRRPAGWIEVQHVPFLTQALFGIPGEEAASLTPAQYCARVLASLLNAALSALDNRVLVINYRDLPIAVWTQLAPFLNFRLTCHAIDTMRDIAYFDAKAPGRTPFSSTIARLSRQDRLLVDTLARGLYEGIESRRHDRIRISPSHVDQGSSVVNRSAGSVGLYDGGPA
jgi:hypothetical protein